MNVFSWRQLVIALLVAAVVVFAWTESASAVQVEARRYLKVPESFREMPKKEIERFLRQLGPDFAPGMSKELKKMGCIKGMLSARYSPDLSLVVVILRCSEWPPDHIFNRSLNESNERIEK